MRGLELDPHLHAAYPPPPPRLPASAGHCFPSWGKKSALSWLSSRYWELPCGSLPNLAGIPQGGCSPVFFC